MIRLFYNYYEDRSPDRKKEIDFCLQKNLSNNLINTIIIESQVRITYNSFFERINQIINDESEISVICNSDIFLDETINLANKIQNNQVFALSRWDWYAHSEPVFFDRQDSQDTWIIKGKVKNVDGNFPLGKRGCDNRIAYEFQKAGYEVGNPSKSIKTYHFHSSSVRNYTEHDIVSEPYLTIFPTEIK